MAVSAAHACLETPKRLVCILKAKTPYKHEHVEYETRRVSTLAASRGGTDVKLKGVRVLPDLPKLLEGDTLRWRLANGVKSSNVNEEELVAASTALVRSLGRSICCLVRLGNTSFGILMMLGPQQHFASQNVMVLYALADKRVGKHH
jgi:hypothetical protein